MSADSSLRHRLGEKITIHVPGVSKPEDCSLLLGLAMKYLLFGKNIIPYPYNVLDDVVKRDITDTQMSSRQVMFEELHKRKASATITKVDRILKGLEEEFSDNSEFPIKEVAFLIGPTVNCPKEVYLFQFPDSYPAKNASSCAKRDLIRHMFLNEDFMKFSCKPIQRTNMYVILKKPQGNMSAWITPMPHYDIPARAPCALMQLVRTIPIQISVSPVTEKTEELSISERNLQLSDIKVNSRDLPHKLAERKNHLCDITSFISPLTVHDSYSDVSNIENISDKEVYMCHRTSLRSTKVVPASVSNIQVGTIYKSCAVVRKETSISLIGEKIREKSCLSSAGSSRDKMPDDETPRSDGLIWYIACDHISHFRPHKSDTQPAKSKVKKA